MKRYIFLITSAFLTVASVFAKQDEWLYIYQGDKIERVNTRMLDSISFVDPCFDFSLDRSEL